MSRSDNLLYDRLTPHQLKEAIEKAEVENDHRFELVFEGLSMLSANGLLDITSNTSKILNAGINRPGDYPQFVHSSFGNMDVLVEEELKIQDFSTKFQYKSATVGTFTAKTHMAGAGFQLDFVTTTIDDRLNFMPAVRKQYGELGARFIRPRVVSQITNYGLSIADVNVNAGKATQTLAKSMEELKEKRGINHYHQPHLPLVMNIKTLDGLVKQTGSKVTEYRPGLLHDTATGGDVYTFGVNNPPKYLYDMRVPIYLDTYVPNNVIFACTPGCIAMATRKDFGYTPSGVKIQKVRVRERDMGQMGANTIDFVYQYTTHIAGTSFIGVLGDHYSAPFHVKQTEYLSDKKMFKLICALKDAPIFVIHTGDLS